MESKTIFVVTPKGEAEIKKQTSLLSGDVKRALLLLDNKSTVTELSRRAAPSLRAMLHDMLQELLDGGFIQDQSKLGQAPRMAIPRSILAHPAAEQGEDLDFTSMPQAPVAVKPAGGKAPSRPAQPQAEPAQVAPDNEQQAIKKANSLLEEEAAQQAIAARLKAEQAAAIARQELEAAQNRADEEARMRAEAEIRATQQAEAARLKAAQEIADAQAAAEVARLRLEQKASEARAEAEAARIDAERARLELDAAKARAEEEVAQRQAEQAAAKTQHEAETRRIGAEQEAARHTAEQERIRLQAEAQEKAQAESAARREAEQIVIQERAAADAARLKAEQDAQQARIDAEKAQAEAERMRAELAAARERAAEETAQLKAAQAQAAELQLQQAENEARIKAELEAASRQAEQEKARLQAETEEKLRVEAAAAQLKAEQEAVQRQEAQAAQREAEKNAEAARTEARQEAEKARALAEQQAEAARAWAEQEAEKIKAEAKQQLEAARLEASQETARVQAEIAAARLLAEQQTAFVQSQLEAAQAQAQADADAKQKAELARDQAEQEIARLKSETPGIAVAEPAHDTAPARNTMAAVICLGSADAALENLSGRSAFKERLEQLLSVLLRDFQHTKYVMLDTGTGAALAFPQHPEHAIELALKLRDALGDRATAITQNHTELRVKTGIHLGTINITHDAHSRDELSGDALAVAQIIMGYAAAGGIYISRAYYDLILRQYPEYSARFTYHGAEKDAQGHIHQIYEVTGAQAEISKPQDEPDIQLAPFALGDLKPAEADDEVAATKSVSAVVDLQVRPVGAVPDHEAQQNSADKGGVEHGRYIVPQDSGELKSAAEMAAEAKALARYEAQQQAQAEQARAAREAAKLRATQEARRLAEEQARLWTEAEQHAQAQSAAEAARVAAHARAQAETQAAPVRQQRAAKIRGAPLPWGKIVSVLVILTLALAFVLPYVWPMQGITAQIEKMLSAQLQQPVHIARINAVLLPMPKLHLQNITIGRTEEFKAAEAVLNFSPGGLLSDIKPIDSMVISGLVLSAEALEKTLPWLQAAGGAPHYPILQLQLQHASISGAGLNLPAMDGTAQWDRPGHIAKAALRSADGKLKLELLAQPTGWKASLQVRESSLPLLPGMLFNELTAEIRLSEDAAIFDQLSGRLYGGELSGSARLDWQRGWRMQGLLAVKGVDLHAALPLYNVAGTLVGNATFSLAARSPGQLADAPQLDGNFTVSKGIINKIDVVETASAGNRQSGASGRTHFDELSGVLQASGHSQHLRQLRMAGGVMNAGGNIDIGPDKQLSGRLTVNLKMRSDFSAVPLALSGTLTEPMLHIAR